MDEDELKDIQKDITRFKEKYNKPSGDLRKSNIDVLEIALDVVSSIIVGITAGIFLDRFFKTSPLFSLIFSLIGMFAGYKIIWQKLNTKDDAS